MSRMKQYDLVIYGGTAAGITAAVQATIMGKSAVVIEQSRRIGGMTTGGLGGYGCGNERGSRRPVSGILSADCAEICAGRGVLAVRAQGCA
ncbi:FAD-dependent oxidoreductase [Paenibacillus rhizoplanae]